MLYQRRRGGKDHPSVIRVWIPVRTSYPFLVTLPSPSRTHHPLFILPFLCSRRDGDNTSVRSTDIFIFFSSLSLFPSPAHHCAFARLCQSRNTFLSRLPIALIIPHLSLSLSLSPHFSCTQIVICDLRIKKTKKRKRKKKNERGNK